MDDDFDQVPDNDTLTLTLDGWEGPLDLLLTLARTQKVDLAQISIRQNDDMRRISATVGLIAAPTLVGSIYGMNFHNMPELSWTLGYPMALLLMLASSLTVWIISKRAGWL